MRPHLVTPPASEPVTLAEAKAHLRLELGNTDEDAYVTALIQAAREHAEQHLWRGIVSQTLELVLERFPSGDCVELPGGHLQGVETVQHVGPDGVLWVMPPAAYVEDTVSVPGRLRLAYGASWPSTRAQWDAVRIRYVVGWEPGEVPQAIKQAVLLLVGQMHEHRVPEVTGTIVSQVRFAAEALLSPYRLVRL